MACRRFVALLALACAACGSKGDRGVLEASLIGDAPRLSHAERPPVTSNNAVLMAATAMGLVAFDASGQVEPALAESWIVTDDGLGIIFRIRRLSWRDGSEVTGDEVAASLNRSIADSRNRLKPLLSAIDTVVGMTGRVVEIRMKVPRPNLLQLLAQPELGIRRKEEGLGPFTATTQRTAILLGPRDAGSEDEDDLPASDSERVRLHTERAALAVVRFQAGSSRLVLGGTAADWPIARVAGLDENQLRLDQANGLFGLAVIGTRRFLQQPDIRAALAMAIDRDALAAALGVPGWQTIDHVLPQPLDSAGAPAIPAWSSSVPADRISEARRRVQAWSARNGAVPVLRIALPPGLGMRLLFVRIATDFGIVGVPTQLVAIDAPDADLRLIDEVAPNSSANWYLTTLSCTAGLVCDAAGDTALAASRGAANLNERATLIQQADAATVARAAFIPLGTPIRWSVVDSSLTGWRDNPMAVHPLGELRPARTRN